MQGHTEKRCSDLSTAKSWVKKVVGQEVSIYSQQLQNFDR